MHRHLVTCRIVRLMKTNKRIEQILDEAQNNQQCATGSTDRDRRALLRRAREETLIRVHRNIYVRKDYWKSLTSHQQCMHVARALAQLHPQWVFAGLTAACAHGFEHQYSLHRNMPIFVADSHAGEQRSTGVVNRLFIPSIRPVTVNGLQVTDAKRTLIDCAHRYAFRDMLPMVDSAARHGVDIVGLPSLCRSLCQDSAAIARLCEYADPLSENGGESLARAIMIEQGFMVPRLQREFPNPTNPEMPYRTDFIWEFHDTVIVGEYDGVGKYVMPDARRDTIQAKVHAEREREAYLLSHGVTRIVRFGYDDVTHPERLARKLLDAGVPQRHRPLG